MLLVGGMFFYFWQYVDNKIHWDLKGYVNLYYSLFKASKKYEDEGGQHCYCKTMIIFVNPDVVPRV